MQWLPKNLAGQTGERLSAMVGAYFRPDLLQAIDAQLLLHGDQLIELGSGRSEALHHAADEGHSDRPTDECADIAHAARVLLGHPAQPPRVVLFVAPEEFVATPYELPGVAPSDVSKALQLQLPDLLPGINTDLMLAVGPAHSPEQGRGIAFWMPMARANALFQAFEAAGQFLVCIVPRPFAALSGNASSLRVVDADAESTTLLVVEKGAVGEWLQVAQADLEDARFAEQWQEQVAAASPGAGPVRECRQARDWLPWEGGELVDKMPAFYPAGAMAFARYTARRTKRFLLIAGAAVLVLVLVAPFAKTVFHKAQLESQVAELEAATAEVRKMRADVVSLESEWAVLNDYPHQDAAAVLAALNNLVPKDSWVSAFKVKDGVVEIEGFSPNPARLVEILSGNPAFVDVAFSRASRTLAGASESDRFGVRFRLQAVDLEAYLSKHFAGSQ